MRSRTALALTLATAVAVPLLAGFAGTDLFIPMAGRGVGAYPSNWFTTVYLYNPNQSTVSVDLSFLERNKDNVATAPPKVTDTLAPGETKVYENIVETTFGKTAYGAVRIQCAEKVVASARVFSKESDDAPLTQSFGQDFAATPASFAIGLNESTDILGGYTTQAYQDSEARFNIGCVETTGVGSAKVHWVARDASGVERAAYNRVVPRLSQTQGFFHDYFTGVDLTNARISANVIAGSGKVICYGSLVTNDKAMPKPVQDPTTFEMVYPEKLLGIANVQHDTTLTGDGTAGAPLGLADGAVTAAKLAPGAVGTAQLPDQGVTSEKLADASVTLPKIATTNTPLAAPPRGVSALTSATPNVLTTDGSTLSWQPVAAGGITAVNAGTGLSGGGTSGDVTVGIANQGVGSSQLSDNAVTDQKVANGLAYSKLSGAPTSLPPSGAAGGSLSGTYPTPGIATGAVTKGKISATGGTPGQVLGTNGSALQWQTPTTGDITAVTAGTGLSGGGTSGDVTVGIINQGVGAAQLADNAVTNQKVASGIAYSKLTGAPTSLPPSGAAGGSLSGTYPNPGIADSAVTDAKVANGIAYAKLSGAPTSLPPSGTAGGSLSGTYPNPTIASGAVTKSNLSASGGTSGQLLGTDGTNLRWATEFGDISGVAAGSGLGGGGTSGNVLLWVAAPLALSAASSSATINATNSSTGPGVSGTGANGVEGYGTNVGGLFRDTNNGGVGQVGAGPYGVFGTCGTSGGVTDPSGGFFICGGLWINVATSTYKIDGPGSVAFVQNHPAQEDRVIVYNAPEGDEVATYTRGTARLVGGEARVPLGETFKWVTNPNLGLTAHLTPVGRWCNLYVAEKGTEALIVRSSGGDDCTFDYIVYGLRIGFEGVTIVQDKEREAYIPSMKDHRERIAKNPELGRYTAKARFTADRAARGETAPADESRAQALLSAIHEFDPAVDKVESGMPPGAEVPPGPPRTEQR